MVVARRGRSTRPSRSTLRGQIDTALRDRAHAARERDPGPTTAGPGGGPGDGDDRATAGGRAEPVRRRRGLGAVRLAARARSLRPARRRVARCPSTRARRRSPRAGTGSYFSDAHVQRRAPARAHGRARRARRGADRAAADRGRPRAARSCCSCCSPSAAAASSLAAALGGVVARAALAPVARFTRRTEALTANPDLSQRLEIEGQDELARLARSFNATLDALERSAEAQRHLVADASHELRTPIASLRANIQVLAGRRPAARGGAREPARRHHRGARRADRARRRRRRARARRASRATSSTTCASTRSCARSSSAPSAAPATASCSARACSRPSSAASPSASAARSRTCSATRTSGARPAGSIEIDLRDGTLTVRDHGPGFDEADLPHVFDRFYRADSARGMPGSGLGLAIVRQAAEAHGGWVERRQRARRRSAS